MCDDYGKMAEQPTPERDSKGQRDELGRWLPGQKPPNAGRNGGRNPGLAARTRKATHDGRDIVDYWVAVLADAGEKTTDRLRAAELLANRGWGQPNLDIDATLNAGPSVEAMVVAYAEACKRLADGS